MHMGNTFGFPSSRHKTRFQNCCHMAVNILDVHKPRSIQLLKMRKQKSQQEQNLESRVGVPKLSRHAESKIGVKWFVVVHCLAVTTISGLDHLWPNASDETKNVWEPPSRMWHSPIGQAEMNSYRWFFLCQKMRLFVAGKVAAIPLIVFSNLK